VLDFNCKTLFALPVCVFHSACFGVKRCRKTFSGVWCNQQMQMEALDLLSRCGNRIRASEVLLVIDVGGNHHSA
jgi:hypothetical protein